MSGKEKGKERQINKVIAAKRKGKNDKLEKKEGGGGLKEPQINKVMSGKEKGKERQIRKEKRVGEG